MYSALQFLVGAGLMLEADGRYLSLATDWRNGYKKFLDIFPGGMLMKSEKSKQMKELRHIYWKLRKYFLDIIMLRIRPWANFIGALRNISEALKKTVAKELLKVILFFADLLCEKRSSDTA